MSKSNLVKVFKETLEICSRGWYKNSFGHKVSIEEELRLAKDGTQLFGPDFLNDLEGMEFDRREGELKIEVTKESTIECGIRLWNEGVGGILALNFASGLSIGGGVVYGAKAQEEDICRCSGLYECLNMNEVEDYYFENRASLGNSKQTSGIYTDNIIYSPKVSVFRNVELELLDMPVEISFITSPAPCVRDLDLGIEGLEDYINKKFALRAVKLLILASYLGYRELILGAWGCGAFGNDPVYVARMFREILEMKSMDGLFDRVVFAIYAQDDMDINYRVFKEEFNGI